MICSSIIHRDRARYKRELKAQKAQNREVLEGGETEEAPPSRKRPRFCAVSQTHVQGDDAPDSGGYLPPTLKRPRKRLDRLAPKRGRSAFLFFSSARRPSLMEENPTFQIPASYLSPIQKQYRQTVYDVYLYLLRSWAI